jgi:HEAT repeat protein
MKAPSARPFLIRALADPIELVRGRAARALSLIATEEELPLVLSMLDDTSQIVRYQIQLGLAQRGVDSFPQLFVQTFATTRDPFARAMLTLLAEGLTHSRSRSSLLEMMLEDPSPRTRADGVRLAIIWGDRALLRRAARLKKHERNSMVLYQLYRIIEEEKKSRGKKGDDVEAVEG